VRIARTTNNFSKSRTQAQGVIATFTRSANSDVYNIVLIAGISHVVYQLIYYEKGESRFDSRQGREIVLFSSTFILNMGPTQCFIQCISGALSPAVG
jgi:hypothetical protein